MWKLLNFIKAAGLVTVAIGALVIGPLLGILAIVIMAIWIAYLIMMDHRQDLKDLESDQ